MYKKGLLIILDGYGEGPDDEFNAVKNAKTPFLDFIKENCPTTYLHTHGKYVGLGDGMMGGSEVGHENIGAGRVVKSKMVRIDEDMQSGAFLKNETLTKMLNATKEHNGAVHLIGLLSDKNIHSNISHLFAFLQATKNAKIQKAFVHVITDGRDSGVYDSNKYLAMLNDKFNELKIGEVASIGGRFFAMDRENNTDRTSMGFNAMFFNKNKIANLIEYVDLCHKARTSDEYIEPKRVETRLNSDIEENDLLIFFNTREDRMRQLLTLAESKLPKTVNFLTMTNYGIKSEKAVCLYDEPIIQGVLSEYISSLGLKQLKISETTKYAHVTYFINGRREAPFENEFRIHVPTLKNSDYSMVPKMRAVEIGKIATKSIKGDNFDLIIINFSNPDMLGHTANYSATVEGLEVIDKVVKKVVNTAFKKDYTIVLTADHGNAEQLRDKKGAMQTAHTLNPVFFSIVDKSRPDVLMKKSGALCDVAPTLLALMNIPPAPKFEGKVLFVDQK